MAKTYELPMIQTFRCPVVQVTTENNTKDPASANNQLLVTGAAEGTKVVEIYGKMAGTSVAATLLVFITEETGTTYYLFDEIAITAITSAVGTATYVGSRVYQNLFLASGQKLSVGISENTSGTNLNVYAKIGEL